MNRTLKSLLTILILSFFCVSSVAYARPSFNPKGWFKGKKTGWHGESTPPGLSKKELKAQKKAAKKQVKKTENAAQDAAENAQDTVAQATS